MWKTKQNKNKNKNKTKTKTKTKTKKTKKNLKNIQTGKLHLKTNPNYQRKVIKRYLNNS